MSQLSRNLLTINSVFLKHIRFGTGWTHRRPRKVYTAEEYENLGKKNVTPDQEDEYFEEEVPSEEVAKIKWKQPRDSAVEFKINRRKRERPLVIKKQDKNKSVDMLETTIDQDGNLIYTKMANNDHRVGSILTEVKSRKTEEKDTILLEGKRLIKDALISNCRLKYLLFSRKEDVEEMKPFLPKMGGHLYKMPYRELQNWSDVETNQGIMAIVKTPKVEQYEPESSLPITVICDNVREPGNLGAILRTCASLTCSKVILSKGCVNLWDTKVLRSAGGAHFKLRIHKNVILEDIEGDLAGQIFIADNKIVSSNSDEGGNDELTAALATIPVVPYYSINYTDQPHVNIIIGGETFGISTSSYKLALNLNGVLINIPLSNDVDSLNVGTALGIITFEIKRQFLMK